MKLTIQQDPAVAETEVILRCPVLDARLECDFPNRPPEYLWNVLTARADQGGEYLDGWLSRGGQTGLGWSQTNLMLYDFDPAAEQVYLEYLPGTELSLTIDLKEGKLT